MSYLVLHDIAYDPPFDTEAAVLALAFVAAGIIRRNILP